MTDIDVTPYVVAGLCFMLVALGIWDWINKNL